MAKKKLPIETVVIVECIFCRNQRVIKAGEVPAGDFPMCEKCYNPMVAIKAEQRRTK
jgi:hypothetical protein